jgi:hypothetical protein
VRVEEDAGTAEQVATAAKRRKESQAAKAECSKEYLPSHKERITRQLKAAEGRGRGGGESTLTATWTDGPHAARIDMTEGLRRHMEGMAEGRASARPVAADGHCAWRSLAADAGVHPGGVYAWMMEAIRREDGGFEEYVRKRGFQGEVTGKKGTTTNGGENLKGGSGSQKRAAQSGWGSRPERMSTRATTGAR